MDTSTIPPSVFKKSWTLPLIIIATGLNLAGSYGAQFANVPLFLDSFMTFAVVALAGLWPGLAVAFATNAILAGLGLVGWPFMTCHLLTALGAWLVFRRRTPDLTAFLWAGLLSAVSNGIIGSIISYMVFHGVTSIPQIDNLVLGVVTACQNLSFSVFWGGLLTNLVDKGVSSVLAFLLWLAYQRVVRRPGRDALHS